MLTNALEDNRMGRPSALQGIIGSARSGKSALVHRYLTGAYMSEESPEGMCMVLMFFMTCRMRIQRKAVR